MGKKRTQAYTEEFRKEAVRLADLPGNKSSQIASDLGISTQQIYNWRRQFNRLSYKRVNCLFQLAICCADIPSSFAT